MVDEIDFTWLIAFVFAWLFLAIFIDLVTSTRTNLHEATIDGNYQWAKKLLDRGIDPDITKRKGMTPLFCAIKNDRIEIVKLLLDYGANINLEYQGNWPPVIGEYSFNPLLGSIILDRQEITQLLVDRGAEKGIHYFCAIGDKDTVTNFLQQRPELIDYKLNTLGVMHFAIFSGSLELIDLLLEKGTYIDDFSKMYGTPLHLALSRKTTDIQIIRHLIKLGANLESFRGSYTPLSIAASSNNIPIVDLLIRAGANLDPSGFNVTYPLIAAVECERIEIASILLENGANIHRRQRLNGDTVLHVAVSNNDILMTDLLIHYGANVDECSYFGSTPLGLSHSNIKLEKIEKLLLQYGADNYGTNE